MTTADLSAQGEALDYRETVTALTEAMQAVTIDERELAVDTATELARAGLVLVRMQQPPGLTRTGHEAASEWFGRKED